MRLCCVECGRMAPSHSKGALPIRILSGAWVLQLPIRVLPWVPHRFYLFGVPALAKRMTQSGWTAVHAAEVEQLATGRLACLDARPAVTGQQIWPGSGRQAPASGSASSRSSVFEDMLDEMDEMEAVPSRVLPKLRGQDTCCVHFHSTHTTLHNTGPLRKT